MNEVLINKIADAVLYEGYILYTYRRSKINQQSWTFGCVFPHDYGNREPWQIETQCLLHSTEQSRVRIMLRFLQLIDRSVCKAADGERIDDIEIDGKRYQSWQESVERTVELEAGDGVIRREFEFPAHR